ncbi:propanediol dehydratase [Secundilactobacillus paracollinoides]|uniref:Propanediol dehydratase n=1 Tax=Secundilactobacillus paracollinoides TaxID=240427 RepID=A0A1B2IYN1_9LACO|nr:diol dehydratase small subunit [Secundilactobacillus paracollinoides]ANZ61188.1 propanediol dehydratase [Secundilactobacillus paracollinoides]ANZ64418.1 propanediol dehydratase [Secundilactobacillus paracollinoides]ANZ67110.1 propanediol dehydratase [Secundilactobacillus paracollinoides]
MSEVDDLVARIAAQLQQGGNASSASTSASTATSSEKELGAADYPLFEKHSDLIKTPTGQSVNEITLENVVNGKVTAKDMRITPATLKLQGEIAANAGRPAIQRNMQRASELTSVPDDVVLNLYNSLRPFRSTKQELLDTAKDLRDKYHAPICAAWFEEAATNYEVNKKLKGDK